MDQASIDLVGESSQLTYRRKRKRRRRCKRHPQGGPHSPTCRGDKTESTPNVLALVRVLPKMKPILDYLDVKADTFTRAEVLGHLTEYIRRKSLYDPADPHKVYCENDELEEVFGCKEFSSSNVCDLLLQNLESFPSARDSENAHSVKQRRSIAACRSVSLQSTSTTESCPCSDSELQSASDQACCSKPLPQPSVGEKREYDAAFTDVDIGHGSEDTNNKEEVISMAEYAIHYRSMRDNSTDIVTDTSDDLFFLYETEEERVVRSFESDITDSEALVNHGSENDTVSNGEERFSLEYEPMSYSEEERLMLEHETERTSCSQEVDEGEDGGDELGNGDSSDSEIEEEDKWQCEACSERNHPMTRRCRRCWSKRKDWFASTLERSYSDPGRTRRENVRIDQATVSDSVCTTSSTSQLNTVAPPSTNYTPPVSTTVANETASDSTDGHDRMRCLLCHKEPPNGCIVHGMTGHQVCCVACARKLKESNKPCPVCRKKIDKVIKNYM